MKFPFKINDQVCTANDSTRIGTITNIDNPTKEFSVRWEGWDSNMTYPTSFAEKLIISIEPVFRNEDNPNITFKRSKGRKPK